MMELNNGNTVSITLEEDEGGKDQVVFSLDSSSHLKLTPYQARVLATELIMAVNRAEVRGNLKRSHNFSRMPEQAAAGGFQQVFAK
ncbi:MAG TPA: hypothetical protein VEP67_06880 [Thiobacillaceae bacterium]|nr:hypothetical protein [Thiobacillaceae bacterium]